MLYFLIKITCMIVIRISKQINLILLILYIVLYQKKKTNQPKKKKTNLERVQLKL